MTWRRLIEVGGISVVVPFGWIEQHGGHLPIGADALLADVVDRELAARLRAVLAPTLRVGYAERQMHVARTLTLRPATLTNVTVEPAAA